MASNQPKIKDHMNLCLDFANGTLGQEILHFEAAFGTSGRPAIQHEHLWMAFKPGVLIYQIMENSETVFALSI